MEVAVEQPSGAGSFEVSGAAYDQFMGRYSQPLAVAFAEYAGVVPGQLVLDAGCGPGALTGVLVERVGAEAVSAFDPSEPFVSVCESRNPGVDVRLGRLEAIPFEDARFDVALTQLVMHFVSNPPVAAAELRRVVRGGGVVGACVWDRADGMEVLRCFWDAAAQVVPPASDEARTLRFGGRGELSDWLGDAGFCDVSEATLEVESTYDGFDELWSGFLQGIGPAGAFCLSLPETSQTELRRSMFDRLDRPEGAFTLRATARVSVGRNPE